MINPLIALDDLLIDRGCQPLADWVQARWGRTCFWLEKQSLVIAYAGFILWTILDIFSRPLLDGFTLVMVPLQILSILFIFTAGRFAFPVIDRIEAMVVRSGGMNSSRLTCRSARIGVFWIAVVIDVLSGLSPTTDGRDLVFAVVISLLAIPGYFAACSPRPPTAKRHEVPNAVPHGA